MIRNDNDLAQYYGLGAGSTRGDIERVLWKYGSGEFIGFVDDYVPDPTLREVKVKYYINRRCMLLFAAVDGDRWYMPRTFLKRWPTIKKRLIEDEGMRRRLVGYKLTDDYTVVFIKENTRDKRAKWFDVSYMVPDYEVRGESAPAPKRAIYLGVSGEKSDICLGETLVYPFSSGDLELAIKYLSEELECF